MIRYASGAVASDGAQPADGRAMKVRLALRRRELHTMPLTTLRRYLIVGALAAILTMAGVSPANARDLGTAGHAWLWLQDVWTQGISVLWAWQGRDAPNPGRASGIISKQGLGLDPNGST
jgi:hypothetical protein